MLNSISHKSVESSTGQGDSRLPILSPLREIYLDWERRFIETLLVGWRRKLERLFPELHKLYPDKSKHRRAYAFRKGGDDLLGLPPEFWEMWEQGYIEDILPFMTEGAQLSANMAIGDLESRFSVSVEPGKVDTDIAEWANEHTMKLVRKRSRMFRQTLTETDKKNLRANLASWIETGGTFPELVQKLQTGTWMSIRRARMIAITEATRAYTVGQQTVWKESGVVDANRWNTARDELVCPVCAPLDGVTVKLGEMFFTDLGEVEGPPAHVQCRGWPTPVVQDWRAGIDAITLGDING